jgi:anti-anti-sigma factor
VQSVQENAGLVEENFRRGVHCVVDMSLTGFIDSTGVGWLISLQKNLRAAGLKLVLLAPTPAVTRALRLMRLTDFFEIVRDPSAVDALLTGTIEQNGASPEQGGATGETLVWRGEITAANAESVWELALPYLKRPCSSGHKTIDLSRVRFIDSTGLGLMIRAKKLSLSREESLKFVGLQPAVRNVIRLSRLESFLLGPPLVKEPQAA